MKHVSLLIKPASSLCNLRCRYCFYHDISDIRDVKSYGRMTLPTAERLIRSAFEEVSPGGSIQFAFQGGEPTLAGLPFFRSFLELESRYALPGVSVSHAIQTNGTLLDEEWADFLRRNRFLVGLSVDGPKDIHDLYRLDSSGDGTWNRVTQALRLLQKHQVDVNLLCVVTGACAKRPQKVYHALQKLGVRYLQFIACLDPLEEKRGSVPYSLTPELYGRFLCGLFDAWYLDWKNGSYTSVRLFDDYIHLMLGQPPGACAAAGQCGSYLVVEGDGSLYPCDFYVLDGWKLGEAGSCSLEQAGQSPLALRFRDRGPLPPACRECEWFPLCRGGCKRDWQAAEGVVKNYYCDAFRTFFAYAYPRLCEIAQAELRAQRLGR